MVDPLAQVVALLQPTAHLSKHVAAAGDWRIRRTDAGQPFYCAVLEGSCQLAVDGHEAIVLHRGDFALVPAAFGFSVSSLAYPDGAADSTPVQQGAGLFRVGDLDGPADVRMVAGHCHFGSPDAALLVSRLPQVIHVHGEQRLATLVQLVGEETGTQRPAREAVLGRLLEVLLIEALRSTTGKGACPGLARGLADPRLAGAIRAMHEHPARPWTVAQLAKEAALSRSAFFERFGRTLGAPPMEYLLAWRMALAKDALRRHSASIASVAESVGYSSASTFSTAFSRHVGCPPAGYARAQGLGSGL